MVFPYAFLPWSLFLSPSFPRSFCAFLDKEALSTATFLLRVKKKKLMSWVLNYGYTHTYICIHAQNYSKEYIIGCDTSSHKGHYHPSVIFLLIPFSVCVLHSIQYLSQSTMTYVHLEAGK